ncbi:hypothetical protein DM02DRAFT_56491 [Periconia macrospinosa]|uniref:Uncharacterized protein n=1 Tax=Periconia macrospinosa TaxID=97972 RepID=A0A2V1E624_9PLEO|nr:hypothetical protein DM02DRAFT_56491 [Periconia macrospinosa]
MVKERKIEMRKTRQHCINSRGAHACSTHHEIERVEAHSQYSVGRKRNMSSKDIEKEQKAKKHPYDDEETQGRERVEFFSSLSRSCLAECLKDCKKWRRAAICTSTKMHHHMVRCYHQSRWCISPIPFNDHAWMSTWPSQAILGWSGRR